MNCLIGYSNHTGGGVVIFENLKKAAVNREDWLIIYPKNYQGNRSKELKIARIFNKEMPLMMFYLVVPFYLKRNNISLILNLMDIPLLYRKQAFLFDWPYLPYKEIRVTAKFLTLARIKLKMNLFRFTHGYISLIGYQHKAIEKRMLEYNKGKTIKIWPNAINLLANIDTSHSAFDVSKKLKILILSKAYAHKRLEEIELLERILTRRNLDYEIRVTISAQENDLASSIVNRFKSSARVKFTGNIPLQDIPSVYNWCDFVFLPSILESFSGLLVESAYYKRRILCVNSDFNTEVAGNNAIFYESSCEASLEIALDAFIEQEKNEGRSKLIPNRLYDVKWKELSHKILEDCNGL